MSMLKLKPACKDYLWGGDKLRTDFGVESDLHPLAEAWVLSCHPDGPSVIVEGPGQGMTLAEYIAEQGKGILGADCEKFEDFPILTKLIDAKDNLSIQVHPSNEYALEHEHQYGKTEMWYILDCEPGAFLYYGFDHAITKEEFERRIQDNTLTEVLNAAPVHKGDVFFIPSGTLHANLPRHRDCRDPAELQRHLPRVRLRPRRRGRQAARALHIRPGAGRHPADPARAAGFRCAPGPVRVFHRRRPRRRLGRGSLRKELCLAACGGRRGRRAKRRRETMAVKKGDSVFLPAGSGAFTVRGQGLKTICTRV